MISGNGAFYQVKYYTIMKKKTIYHDQCCKSFMMCEKETPLSYPDPTVKRRSIFINNYLLKTYYQALLFHTLVQLIEVKI